MKTRHIVIALAAVAAAGIWFGRLAWRAHHILVTLHARNMPLAEVVGSLERQTWENIRLDKSMNAKITLNVEDAPLERVLDLVADRAGARWQKTFAVGVSGRAMKKLESVLEGAAKLDAAGWTNLAPQFPAMENPGFPPGGPDQLSGRPGRFITRTFPGGGGGSIGGGGGGGGRFIGPGGGGSRMVTSLPDGTIDQWSSERLVLESDLRPLLSGELPEDATPETAAHVASAVHGKSHLYYALEKAPFGMEGPRPGARFAGPAKPGHDHPAPGDMGANMAQWRRQQRLRELSRSPEEQVERARQNRSGGGMRIQANEESN